MKYLKLFEDFKSKKLLGYHVTDKRNLKSILETGLEARVPEDFGENGDTKGVYLFKTLEDAETALSSWFGERIEEWEEETGETYTEVCLTVDLTGLESDLLDSVGFEWTCLVDLDKERIIDVNEI